MPFYDIIDLSPIYLSIKLALLTAVLLFICGLPVAYFLSQWKSKFKIVAESFVSLPIILPPTVIGFYLLLIFSPENLLGKTLDSLGIQIPFTFEGILLASTIYSFPFMVQPIQRDLERLPEQYWSISYSLGKSKLETFKRIILPNIKNGIIMGFVLTFAHTIGEFGVILMIGGSIPEVTKVASLAIYSDIEALDYKAAHVYSLILLVISISIIILVNMLNIKSKRRF